MKQSSSAVVLLRRRKKNHHHSSTSSIVFFFFCLHIMAYYLYIHKKVVCLWFDGTTFNTNDPESSSSATTTTSSSLLLLEKAMRETATAATTTTTSIAANHYYTASTRRTATIETTELHSRSATTTITDQILLSTPMNRMYSFTYSKRFVESIQNYLRPQFSTTKKDNTVQVIVYGVLSRPNQKKRRNAIRQSWGKGGDNNHHHHVIFVVASSSEEEEGSNTTTTQVDNDVNLLLQEEFDMYGDILILNNVTENYRTLLVPKTFVLIYWFGKHVLPLLLNESSSSSSSNATTTTTTTATSTSSSSYSYYLFKTDDDVYVNTTFISQELATPRKGDNLPKDYYGRAHIRTKPERHKEAKHYLSRAEYPSQYFPNYAEGVGYAMSSKFVNCATSLMSVHQDSASASVTEEVTTTTGATATNNKAKVKVPWEDVATGVLAKRCGIRLTMAHYIMPQQQQYDDTLPPHKSNPLIYFPFDTYKNGGICNVTLQHGVKPEWMIKLHNQEPLYDSE